MPLDSQTLTIFTNSCILDLRELTCLCLCIYLVGQFPRWINEISKVCYEETQNSRTKYVISKNGCSKNFVHFQEKHPRKIAFIKKVAGYLTLIENVLLGNLCNFKNSFYKKNLRMQASAILTKINFSKNISFNLFNLCFGMCSLGLSV